MKSTKRFLAGLLASALLFSNMSTLAYAADEVSAAEPAPVEEPAPEELDPAEEPALAPADEQVTPPAGK